MGHGVGRLLRGVVNASPPREIVRIAAGPADVRVTALIRGEPVSSAQLTTTDTAYVLVSVAEVAAARHYGRIVVGPK